jgi:hypothetical protein
MKQLQWEIVNVAEQGKSQLRARNSVVDMYTPTLVVVHCEVEVAMLPQKQSFRPR